MRRHDGKEFARGDYLGVLPEFRKMTRIAGYQVVGASGIGAFQEDVVVGIRGDSERLRWRHRLRMAPNELQDLLTQALADLELRAREHFAVFRNEASET